MNTRVEGVGLGLRHDLARELLERRPDEVRWLEIHPENYVARGGRFELNLEEARAHWPIVTHGLTCGVGTASPFEPSYTRELRELLEAVGAPFHSEHLCFGGVDDTFLHDLLPLPFNREAVRTAAARARELRDAIERPLAIENISYYADPLDPGGWTEPDFLLEVLDAADAALLLDVNNVYVNSLNHGFDPRAYIDRIPRERVVQIHVAGHFTGKDGVIIDTHGEPVCEGVYDLLGYTIARLGPVPVLLERDQNVPPLDDLLAEVRRLSAIYERGVAAFEAERAA
ncbi:MAG: DUF692 domain-containing protein [Sandaracinaceae bacterium]|nr:DUF692 domain-containing protein [Sandaracinaceae bacterium]